MRCLKLNKVEELAGLPRTTLSKKRGYDVSKVVGALSTIIDELQSEIKEMSKKIDIPTIMPSVVEYDKRLKKSYRVVVGDDGIKRREYL